MKKNTDSKKTQDYIFDLTDFNAVHFDQRRSYFGNIGVFVSFLVKFKCSWETALKYYIFQLLSVYECIKPLAYFPLFVCKLRTVFNSLKTLVCVILHADIVYPLHHFLVIKRQRYSLRVCNKSITSRECKMFSGSGTVCVIGLNYNTPFHKPFKLIKMCFVNIRRKTVFLLAYSCRQSANLA